MKICAVCGSDKRVERDHVIPKMLGGSDHPKNKRWLCKNHHIETTSWLNKNKKELIFLLERAKKNNDLEGQMRRFDMMFRGMMFPKYASAEEIYLERGDPDKGIPVSEWHKIAERMNAEIPS